MVKNPYNKWIVFTVGLSLFAKTDYSTIIDKNIPAELRNKVKVFHLRGGIDYKKLGLVHRVMMAIMNKMTIGKNQKEELSDEERAFIDTYGNKAYFVDKFSVAQLVNYVRTL